MGIFMHDESGVQTAIAGGVRAIENIHLHQGREPVRRRGHAGVVPVLAVVEAQAILRVRLHGVPAQAAPAKVIRLKITGGFVKPNPYNTSCIQLSQ